MKVKVGDLLFNSENTKIMVILSEIDKENIKNMNPNCSKYCAYPETENEDDVASWMNDI